MKSLAHRQLLPFLLLFPFCMMVSVFAGCKSAPVVRDDAAQRKMLELLMPSRIEIVQPFTRVRGFEQEDVEEGIEVLLQAVNRLDNPGLMIAGDIRIELYSFVPASGNRKGRRIETWRIQIADKEDQRAYWNGITQMYQFKLGLDPEGFPVSDKYVLAVTYNSPLGEHLSDECVVERPVNRLPLGTAID